MFAGETTKKATARITMDFCAMRGPGKKKNMGRSTKTSPSATL